MIHHSPFIFKPKKQYNFTEKPNRNLIMNNRYKQTILTGAQQQFNKVRPVKDFSRFGKGIIADTGINPDQAYINFIRKDIHKPFEQSQNPAYQFGPKEKEIALNSGVFSDKEPEIPLRWSVGCTYECPSPRLLPKRQPFKSYHFRIKTESDVVKKHKFLDTDHISIRIPSPKNTENKTENVKETYGAHAESHSDWIPKIHEKLSAATRSGVEYNIINYTENKLTGAEKKSSLLDKTRFHKLKGICEFSDFRNPNFPNYNKRYQELLSKNNKLFYNYKGICSELYDSAAKNGNLYMPFKSNDYKIKKETRKNNEMDNPII